MVLSVTCLIVFFMLTTNALKGENSTATLIVDIFRISMYLLMTIISVVVILKLRSLDYNSCKSTSLEDILLVISIMALVTLDVIGIISGILYLNMMKGLMVLAISIVELIQSVVQIAAIVMGLKLCIPDVRELSDKPGREYVTFMIVANISLWIMSIFNDVINQGFEVQLMTLGQLSWNIITNTVSPAVAFYHLLSASCFIDIWYSAYRLPSTPVVEV